MKKAHEGIPAHDFNVPEGIVFAKIDSWIVWVAWVGEVLVSQFALIEIRESPLVPDFSICIVPLPYSE